MQQSVRNRIIFSIFLIAIFIFPSSLIAKENKDISDIFSIKIKPEIGILNGSLSEYVFYDKCENTDNVLSRLDWDIITVPYIELGVSVDLFKYLYLGISGRVGLPIYSGVMQDYDWLNSITPEWKNENPTELTNYSIHTNEIDSFYNFKAKIGSNFKIFNNFTITPYVGYIYDYIKMIGSDGYTKYKWNNFEEESIKGKCISYAHELNEFIVGFKTDILLIPRFPIYFDFSLVPGIGKLVALDLHYQANKAFLDIYNHILLFDAKLMGYFKINAHNKIGLSSSFHYMPLTKGKTGVAPLINGKTPTSFNGSKDNMGGTKRFMYGISISYELNF